MVVCVLAAIVAGAGLVRCHLIGSKSLSLAEAGAVKAARGTWGGVFFAPRPGDPDPPLHVAALRLWLRGSASDARARGLSAAASTATLVLLYALARLLLPRWAALVVTGLSAVSACQVSHAQQARPPALAALLVVAGWYVLTELVAGRRLERWPLWLALAVCNLAALYTSAATLLAVLAQLLALLLVWREVGRKLVVPWLVWQLVPLAGFAFYVPVFLERLPAAGGGASAGACLWATARLGAGVLPDLAERLGTAGGVTGIASVVLAVVVGLAGGRRCWAAVAIGLAWLALPLAGAAALPPALRAQVCEPGQVAYAAPALGLLVAAGLVGLRGKLKAIPILIAVAMVWLNAASLRRYYRPSVQREPWHLAGEWMKGHVVPGDMVCLNPGCLRAPFDRGYRGPAILRREVPATGSPLWPGDLGLERRTWVVTRRGRGPAANPALDEALRRYPLLIEQRFPGLRASIELRLFDTRRVPSD